MPDHYRQMDLLVVPSLTRPNWKEQFGRVLIEAMASQVPVIGSNSGEIPNVIGDAGLLFPENDAPALSELIEGLIRDPARRAELGRRGRKRVLDRFTQDQIANETYAVYVKMARG
jgi:glycosyltransferase involved in cell wall biosynthesis